MKASLFITYPLRSLLRGGGATLLAVMCIAIGVMVVVATQLTGQIATNSYVNNARTANGGDISVGVGDRNTPFTQSDLVFFEHLKRAQTISTYTPVNLEIGAIDDTPPPFSGLLVQVVDPQHFPLVTAPTFIAPASGSLATLLTRNQVVVTQTFLTYYHKRLGDAFDLQLQSPLQNGAARILHVRLAGVIANTGMYPAGNTFALISFAAYQAASPTIPVTYDSIDITTPDQAHTDQAIRALQDEILRGRFPLVAIQTVASIQQHLVSFNGQVAQLQELADLLVLLIGGLGIMNTMQVMLSRRRLEIAMLKTTGYSRSSLALLFGIETGVLGLCGGVLGTGAAMAMSYAVVITRLAVAFTPDPWILVSGVALGTVTALIFGLMPLVQSANIRPIQVMREWSGSGSVSATISTLALFGIVSLLFCVLASAILQNIVLGCASVCGTVLFLAVLSLCFRPLIGGISRIPLPERWSAKFLTMMLPILLLAVLLYLWQPVWGGIGMACICVVLILRWLPRPWKINARIALRNSGRRPMRTTMLMLLLFVGVFVIGSIQVMSQDLQNQLLATTNQEITYNVIAKVPSNQTHALQAHLNTLPGLVSSHETTTAATTLVAINGRPWKSFLTPADLNIQPSSSGALAYQILRISDGVEGYDLANQHLPDPHSFQLVAGRNLNASDAGTQHVLIPYSSVLSSRFHLGVGSTLTVASSDGKTSTTLTVIGEYSSAGLSLTHVSPILTSQNIVMALSTAHAQTVFYLKVGPAQVTQAEANIRHAVPGVAFVDTPASRVNDYLLGLSSIAATFTTLAFLVLLAGMIVMANAVVLDLVERRRELGILKALGYTQRTIRGEILLEYGIIGGTSATLAVLLVTLLSNFLGTIFLQATSGELGKSGATVAVTFSANGLLLISLIAGTILLVMITSLLASWRTVRIRPLDVLRYE